MKHVGSSQNRRPFLIKAHICPEQIPISPQNFFRFRIPYDQLLIWVFHRVVFVDIHRQARSSTRSTKGNFS